MTSFFYGFVNSESVVYEEKRLKGRATRMVRLTVKVAKVCSELQEERNAFIAKKNSK